MNKDFYENDYGYEEDVDPEMDEALDLLAEKFAIAVVRFIDRVGAKNIIGGWIDDTEIKVVSSSAVVNWIIGDEENGDEV